MKQCFIPKDFNPTHAYVISEADRILGEYAAQGYDMTLRQLYYQFIAGNLFPDKWLVDLGDGVRTKNHERNYNKLKAVISGARLAGLLDWDAIKDRTRSLKSWKFQSLVKESIEAVIDQDAWEATGEREQEDIAALDEIIEGLDG